MKKAIMYFALILVSGVVFSACLPNQNKEAATEATGEVMVKDEAMEADGDAVMVKDEAMEADGEAMEEGGDAMMKKEVEADYILEMGMFYYEPALIEAEAGEIVTVKLTNAEGFHDFVIDELDVQSEQINEGDETMVTFTIPEDASGETYEFYCSVGNHRAQGMVGTLRVK
jgi:plastocyanin